jgi:hypothetical protein
MVDPFFLFTHLCALYPEDGMMKQLKYIVFYLHVLLLASPLVSQICASVSFLLEKIPSKKARNVN